MLAYSQPLSPSVVLPRLCQALPSFHRQQEILDRNALAGYAHSKVAKIGIYPSPGPKHQRGYEASYGHEEQDARTYARL